MNIIQTVLNTTKLRGGFTVNPITGNPPPIAGYMVGMGKERRVPRITCSDIKQYINDHMDYWYKTEMFLGTWTSNGTVYLDVSQRFLDKEVALMQAAFNGEEAIFDIATGQDIEVTQ